MMRAEHKPRIDRRYWAAITLASVFGTNLGDLYAHTLGLGIAKGLALLAALAALVFVAEHFVRAGRTLYYWLVIILIRTGATNIADYLMYRRHIPDIALIFALAAVIGLFAWVSQRAAPGDSKPSSALLRTDTTYWIAMLGAGVFGTVLGDFSEDHLGEGAAAALLSLVLLAVLAAGWRRAARFAAVYWFTVAVARTAGTAIGDWLAESKALHIGLPLCTLLTGLTFVAVLLPWWDRSRTGSKLAGAVDTAW